MAPEPPETRSAEAVRFATTHWSVVLTAACDHNSKAQAALANLCQTYWYPLYAFVRRQGCSPQDAEDLTQEFFARLMAKRSLRAVDRVKGRFRSFLLAALKHFLANEWARAKCLKRGGGQTLIPLDALSAETRFGREPADHCTPEASYERSWALALLDRVLARLAGEQERAARQAQFAQLQGCLTGALPPYVELAAKLGTTEGAVKVAVHRLRQRYRELLREEIALTVASPAEIEDEIRRLFRALAS
jgi:RNA polymerase sigma-70 factor (ECF subfamily)